MGRESIRWNRYEQRYQHGLRFVPWRCTRHLFVYRRGTEKRYWHQVRILLSWFYILKIILILTSTSCIVSLDCLLLAILRHLNFVLVQFLPLIAFADRWNWQPYSGLYPRAISDWEGRRLIGSSMAFQVPSWKVLVIRKQTWWLVCCY